MSCCSIPKVRTAIPSTCRSCIRTAQIATWSGCVANAGAASGGNRCPYLHLPLLHSNRTDCNMVRVRLGVREADKHLIAPFYCRSLEIEDDFRKEWIAAAKF